MFRIDDATAAGSLPVPEAAGTEGYFTEGNPATNTLATKVRGSWLNMIQEELRAIVVAAGLQPTKGSNDQVFLAITAMASGVVGSCRAAKMVVPTAGAGATFTADEVIVGTALGGIPFRLGNFSQTVSTSATGIGGVVGGELTANGYAAIYAAYNPTTQQQGAFIVNANALVPNVAVAPPSGWTATALISVWPLNASMQFLPGNQQGRHVVVSGVSILSSSTIQASFAALSISGAVPANAISADITLQTLSTSAGTGQILQLSTDANGSGVKLINSVCALANNGTGVSVVVAIATPQTIYWKSSSSGGTPSFTAAVVGYEF